MTPFLKISIYDPLIFNSNYKWKDCHPYLLSRFRSISFSFTPFPVHCQ